MKRILSLTLTMLLCTAMFICSFVTAGAKFDQTAAPKEGDTVAIIRTNYGDIAMSFFEKQAPKGVENFVTLAKDGKYDKTIFHRVIDNFMIQGGDYTNFNGTGGESCWGKEFELECVDELGNIRGAVAYANSGPDTNGSQFFINSADNAYLDGSYTVFGQVFAGMDVVDLISDCEKVSGSDGAMSSPVNQIDVNTIEVTKYKKGMEKELAQPTNPYEGMTSAVEETTEAATEVLATDGADDVTTTASTAEPFDFTPVIVISVIIVVIGGIVAIYVVYDNKQKKKRAELRAQKNTHKKKKK